MYHIIPINTLFFLVLLASQPGKVHAALQHRPVSSFPIDTFASPKFGVSFLNHRPIGRKEADLWQRGLRGTAGTASKGELAAARDETGSQSEPQAEEDAVTWQRIFSGIRDINDLNGDIMPNLWSDPAWRNQYRLKDTDYPTIIPIKLPSVPASGDGRPHLSDLSRNRTTGSTEDHDYLCALPVVPKSSSVDTDKKAKEKQDGDKDVSPDALDVFRHLEPLDGHCLYHRQGWFTYA
jgi:hypothetical protein